MKKLLVALAVIGTVILSGCSLPGTSSGSSSTNDHACADKVVQSLTTNKAVKGVWACLTPKLEQTLTTYVQDGLAVSADDAVFTDGTGAKTSVISTSYVGEKDGVDIYTVVVKRSDGSLLTLTVTVWVDSSGKVDNIAVAGPLF